MLHQSHSLRDERREAARGELGLDRCGLQPERRRSAPPEHRPGGVDGEAGWWRLRRRSIARRAGRRLR